MTINKAIEIISRKSSIPNEGESFEDIEKAYDMAVAALSKQIPKKPIGETTALFGCSCTACPNCKNSSVANLFTYKGFNYCPDCGQELDWSENNS